VIPRLAAGELAELLPRLASGMIPKMEACLYAVDNGVRAARVVDGRTKHSILLQIFTDDGAGTVVVPDDDVSFEGATA
jgi:acetylglutamate kinase